MTATVRGVHITGRQGQVGITGNKEYRVIYKVVTDDKRDGPIIAGVAPGIPFIGDLYSVGNETDLSGAQVIDKQVRQTDSPFEWEVEVVYSTDVGNQEPDQWLNPLYHPPQISFGFQERRILVPGRYNNPIGPPSDGAWQAGIYAPNGDLFDPQPETVIADPVWRITRNEANIDYQTLMALANCVNSDLFNGAEPRTLLMKPPQAVRKYHTNIQYYWEVSYELVYRYETWDIQILNQGYFYWSGGKPSSVWSTTSLPSVKKLASGELRLVNLTTNGDINTTDTPTFTRIRYFREINFAALNIL